MFAWIWVTGSGSVLWGSDHISFGFGQVRFLKPFWSHWVELTIRVDPGSVHCCPSISPSVPTGSSTMAVVHQPYMDCMLLEKKA